MRSRLYTHICTRWIALFVVWFASLAPAVSHALHAADGAAFGAICSTGGVPGTGVEVVDASRGDPPGVPVPQSESGAFAHCLFCVQQGHDAQLPIDPPQIRMPELVRFEVPGLRSQPGHVLQPWGRAQPRAPPRLV